MKTLLDLFIGFCAGALFIVALHRRADHDNVESDYSLQDFKEGKVRADMEALMGTPDIFKGKPNKTYSDKLREGRK